MWAAPRPLCMLPRRKENNFTSIATRPGSDRILGRTGEVANKIGTYAKAVLARRHGIPFYVAIPLSTIDWDLKSGFDIPIEQRHEAEVLGAWGVAGNARSSVTIHRAPIRNHAAASMCGWPIPPAGR